MKLTHYNKKRNFKVTPEPRGIVAGKISGNRFFIQKHDASHLHFDFRLELDGVLKSWAVPKGPSVFEGVRRLAVEVEDHPLSYGDFEGIIPKAEYGGGTVMLWDRGTWKSDGNPSAAIKKGKITFYLKGERLKGKWSLIRSKPNGDKKRLWFLIKNHESMSLKRDPIEKIKTSVLSHRNMKEISKSSVVWKTKIKSKKKNKDTPVTDLPLQKKLPSFGLPNGLKPQLATLVDAALNGDDWLHEIKFDGYRIITVIKNGRARLFSRNGLDWTHRLQVISRAIESMGIGNGIFDGELIVPDKNGHSNFQALQNAFKNDKQNQMIYYIFDVISYEKQDLKSEPLSKRKEILSAIFKESKNSTAQIKLSEYVEGNGTVLLNEAKRLGLEGIVSKRKDGEYYFGRSRDWLKVKCQYRQEFIVVGFSKPGGSREHFGSLLLAAYNESGKLQYVGRTGTGFSEKVLLDLKKKMQSLVSKGHPNLYDPFEEIGLASELTWIKPKLIAEVKFATWTDHKILRQAAYLGLRADKAPKEVKLEQASPTSKVVQHVGANLVSNPDKVLFSPNITKRDLVEYYLSIKKWIEPHLINRPLSLLRCPDGHDKFCFFQKHISISKKKGPGKIKNGKTGEYLYIDSFEGLISLVQLGVLEIHGWGTHIQHLEKPDQIVFDLDADSGVKWGKIIGAAIRIRERLKLLNLKSFVKTTGGKGLHVVVPIIPTLDWISLKTFCKSFATALEEEFPKDYTSNMSKKNRKNKIFIDYLRNGRGATAVIPYSTRAKENAPVSTPITWEELENTTSAGEFTLTKMRSRMKMMKKDPWQGFFNSKQKLNLPR